MRTVSVTVHSFRLISSNIQAKANLLLPFSIGPTVLGCMSDTSAFLIEDSKGIQNKRNVEPSTAEKSTAQIFILTHSKCNINNPIITG